MKPGAKPEIVKEIGDRGERQESVKKEDWNTYRIVAKGNVRVNAMCYRTGGFSPSNQR